ncbi:hypothetical protein BTVI_141332 [Pitangus sulphuratus]|nr:hypothetical protein BTVI_141332 [Pitangus sulphuratus]
MCRGIATGSLWEFQGEEICLHLETSVKGEDLLIGQTALAGAQKSYIKCNDFNSTEMTHWLSEASGLGKKDEENACCFVQEGFEKADQAAGGFFSLALVCEELLDQKRSSPKKEDKDKSFRIPWNITFSRSELGQEFGIPLLQKRLFNTKSFGKKDSTANQKISSNSTVVRIRPLYCTALVEHCRFSKVSSSQPPIKIFPPHIGNITSGKKHRFTRMPNPSMAVKDSYQEQGDEVLGSPISREERKSVGQIPLLLQLDQSRSYCISQKRDDAMGKQFEEEVEK